MEPTFDDLKDKQKVYGLEDENINVFEFNAQLFNILLMICTGSALQTVIC